MIELDPGSAGLFKVAGTLLSVDASSKLATLRGSLKLGDGPVPAPSPPSPSGSFKASLSSSGGNADLYVYSGGTGRSQLQLSSATDSKVLVQATKAASLSVQGGSAAASVKVSSASSTATLELLPGATNKAGTLSLGRASSGATPSHSLSATGGTLTVAALAADGHVKINPGAASGTLNVHSGLLLVQPSLSRVSTSGDLVVTGSLSVGALALPTGTGQGSSGQTINKPAGVIESGTSLLARTSKPNVITVPKEVVTVSNSLVKSSSVVVASVIKQCSVNTAVAIIDITVSSGSIKFTVANSGISDCSNERYSISFIVVA